MTEYCRRISTLASGVGLGLGADTRFALPGSRAQYAPDRQLRARHVKLEIAVDMPGKALQATCTTTLEAVHDGAAEVVFDAVGFKLAKVAVKPGAATHAYDGRKLTVTLKQPLAAGATVDVTVTYRVIRPPLGVYFIAPTKEHPELPTQVWTQCQDEFARYWFPCHDAPQERATTEMIATVPEGFFALSNGGLVSRKASRKRGTVTFHWKMGKPHAPYLVTLAVGRFVEIAESWNGIPITYYVERGREEDGKRAFSETPAMVKFFSEALAYRYPWEKYAQVAASHFVYGGMENTSATTQTDLVLHDARAHEEAWHEGLVAHELAHQWFGDLMTCKDWSQAWLNEGFATYFEALFREHRHGADEFLVEMWGNAQKYFEEDRERYRRAIVTPVWKDPSDVFDRHLYEKGSWVLHMLRGVLGDALYWRAMRHYVKANAGRTVETADLVNAIHEATGKNLRWFFDQWVHRAGHPSYRVVYRYDGRRREVTVWVAQVHKTSDETALFRMPVAIDLHYPGKVVRHVETIEAREQTFTYASPMEPEMFLFDAAHGVLKEAEVVKPPAMWMRQLVSDPHVLGRIEAAAALGKLGTPEAASELGQALLAERFWGVKAEIAKALGVIRTGDAHRFLLQGLGLRHPKARLAVVAALGELRRPDVPDSLREALAAPDSYEVPAEACRAVARSGAPRALSILREQLSVPSWNETIRCGALDGLAALGTEQALALLLPHTRPSYSYLVRAAAVRGLGQAGRGRPQIVDHVIRLVEEPELRVKMAAIQALGRMQDPRAVPALKRVVEEKDIDGRVRRAAEEAIRQVRQGLEEDGKG